MTDHTTRPGPTLRKPPWLRVALPSGEEWARLRKRNRALRVATVCEEAACPNVGECWGKGVATFMILGDVCTRACRFCNVKSAMSGAPIDPDEARNVADSVSAMEARYVVLTSVDRDDLDDGGAGHFAEVIRAVGCARDDVRIEALTPDFSGKRGAIEAVIEAEPDVIGHNIETVERLTPVARDRRASYSGSMEVLRQFRRLSGERPVKSSILLGMGETDAEIERAMRDLMGAGVDILVLGQYLQPTRRHLPVARYVSPAEFDALGRLGEELGFGYVAAAPLARSSYRAEEAWLACVKRQRSRLETRGGSRSTVS